MPRTHIQTAARQRPRGTHTLAVQSTAPDHSGATSDAHLVELWLSRKASAHTRRAYTADVLSLLAHLSELRTTLRAATLADVQSWADGLTGAASSRARRLAAVRSLLAFGHRTGYLPFNVGGVLERVKVPNELAERILTEDETRKLLDAATGRDRALLRCLYASGGRVSEICGLRWAHVHELTDGAAVLTLHGKGGKTRHVLVSKRAASEIGKLRADDVADNAPVFATRTGKPLHPHNVAKMVRAVAQRAGIKRDVSPHWLRHAHASHALDNGAPVSLVQSQLGHASVATTGRYLHAKPGDGSSRYLNV